MSDEAAFALIARWEALAEQAREQMRLSDIHRRSYYEGVMKAYLTAANDLRRLLVPQDDLPASPPTSYANVPEPEAAASLQHAGLFARSLTLHPDGVFTAVFSRFQPITQESRIRQLSDADTRLVIVDHGTLRDTGDPYIDFAFVES